MKKVLFCAFFALISLFAQGQSAEQNTTVRDSSWIINRNGVFFQARQVTQSNGAETTTLTPIGDTVTTTRVFSANIQNETGRMAGDAAIVRQYRAGITELIRFAREIPATINRSPLDSIANSEPNLYTVGFWDINGTGIRFRRTPAGLYQWRADTATVWRPFAYLGGVIRLNALNGYTTDLYRVGNGRQFVSINSQYRVKPVGQTAARTAGRPTDEPEPAPAPIPATTFNNDGTVTTNDGTYKYNSRSKKWVKI